MPFLVILLLGAGAFFFARTLPHGGTLSSPATLVPGRRYDVTLRTDPVFPDSSVAQTLSQSGFEVLSLREMTPTGTWSASVVWPSNAGRVVTNGSDFPLFELLSISG